MIARLGTWYRWLMNRGAYRVQPIDRTPFTPEEPPHRALDLPVQAAPDLVVSGSDDTEHTGGGRRLSIWV